MDKSIVFFSSMSRGLYFDDVIRVLTLQSGSVVKFRYRPKYVLDDVSNKELIGKSAVIVFSDGDYRSDTDVKDFPIRDCIIVKVNESSDSERMEYYLELSDFIEAKIDSSTPDSDLPPNKFATEVKLINYKKISWKSVIENVKESLVGCNSMLYVNGIFDEKNNKMKIEFDEKMGVSQYKLKDASKYYFEYIAHSFDKIDKDKKIEYSVSTSKDIQIFDTYDGKLLTETERVMVPFYVNKLEIPKASRTIELGINNDGTNGFKTKIYASVSKRVDNSIEFGIFSLIFLLSISLGNQLLKEITTFSLCESVKFIVFVIGFISSTSYLYHEFNKK